MPAIAPPVRPDDDDEEELEPEVEAPVVDVDELVDDADIAEAALEAEAPLVLTEDVDVPDAVTVTVCRAATDMSDMTF